MERIDDWCNHEREWDWHPWVKGECPGERPVERGSVVPVTPILSAALEEIWRLRTQLGYLASHLEHAAEKVRGNAQASNLRIAAELAAKAANGTPVWPTSLPGLADRSIPLSLTRAEWERQTFSSGYGVKEGE